MYKVEYFPEPTPYNFGEELVKVPGLDGSGKMGKTAGNGIYLIDDAATIRKKVMRAVTDSGPTQENQTQPEPIQNLFTLLKLVSAKDTVEHFETAYKNCSIRYGDLKKQLAEDIISFTAPIRERILEISADSEYLRKAAQMGAEKARASASKTLEDVRKIIGFKTF
jgi:tryptophanyl-tRNA synthetase